MSDRTVATPSVEAVSGATPEIMPGRYARVEFRLERGNNV